MPMIVPSTRTGPHPSSFDIVPSIISTVHAAIVVVVVAVIVVAAVGITLFPLIHGLDVGGHVTSRR